MVFPAVEFPCKTLRFDLDLPWAKLPQKIRTIILYGSKDELIKFHYRNDNGRKYTRTDVFEGIIPNMERRYRETESAMVREELGKYLSGKPCDACGGARLSEAARHVFVAGMTLPEISAKPIDAAKKIFEELKLTGYKFEIAEKIKKELISRLTFLVNVGLDYFESRSQCRSLSGGEAQRIRLASQIGAGLVGVMYILDEPSIGLHQRDNARLLDTLHYLRDLGIRSLWWNTMKMQFARPTMCWIWVRRRRAWWRDRGGRHAG